MMSLFAAVPAQAKTASVVLTLKSKPGTRPYYLKKGTKVQLKGKVGKKKYSDITRYLRDAIIDDDNVKYFLNRIADDMKKNITNPKALLYMIDLLKSAANASRRNPQSK